MPEQNKTYCQDESGNYGKTIWQQRQPLLHQLVGRILTTTNIASFFSYYYCCTSFPRVYLFQSFFLSNYGLKSCLHQLSSALNFRTFIQGFSEKNFFEEQSKIIDVVQTTFHIFSKLTLKQIKEEEKHNSSKKERSFAWLSQVMLSCIQIPRRPVDLILMKAKAIWEVLAYT